MYEFKLPDLGEGIHEGELLEWYVKVGERVEEDAPMMEVETDKAAVTIPSPKAGIVVALHGKVGDILHVGDVVVVIDTAADAGATSTAAPSKPATTTTPGSPSAGADPETSPAVATSSTKGPSASPASAPNAATNGAVSRGASAGAPSDVGAPASAGTSGSDGAQARSGPVPAAPATRRLARERKVDINRIPGTGPGGRVTPEDVIRFADGGGDPLTSPLEVPAPDKGAGEVGTEARERIAQAAMGAHASTVIPFLDIEPLPDFEKWGPVTREPIRSIRRKVARKMVATKTIVPHVAHMEEIDVTDLEAFRKDLRSRLGDVPGGKVTLLSFVVRAAVAALRAFPSFNASIDPFREEIVRKEFFNIGIAADTGKGLVVPVVHGADRLSLTGIAARIEELAGKAREGRLSVDELGGGTFTVTNIGPLGGTGVVPAINYPEVAIFAMGRAAPKPVVRDGEIVIRTILPVTLAFDHRIADGADAARFVNEMVRLLSDPQVLLATT